MNNRLTLHDIAVILAEQTGKSEADAELFLREFIRIVTDGVCTDRIVKVKGLGTFKLVPVEERESVSVNTGERYQIPAHYKFTFTPDKDLKELVNQPFSLFETTELNDDVEFPELEQTESDNVQEEAAEDSEEELMPEPVLLPEEPVIEEKEQEPIEETVPASAEIQPVAEADRPENEKLALPQEIEESAKKSPKETETIDEAAEEIAEHTKAAAADHAEEEENHAEETKKSSDDFPSSSRSFGMKWAIVFCLLLVAGGVAWLVFDQYAGSIRQQPVEQPVIVADVDSVKSESPSLESTDSVKMEQEEPKQDPLADLDTTTIKPGDRLTSISLRYYGHKFFWVYIFEYNRETIKDPNNVPIGTSLRIPNPARYGIDAKDRTSLDKAVALQSEILSKY